jgi:hypothetical protein
MPETGSDQAMSQGQVLSQPLQLAVVSMDGEALAAVSASTMWTGKDLKTELSQYFNKDRRIDKLLCDGHILGDNQTLQEILETAQSSFSKCITINAVFGALVMPGTYKFSFRYDSGDDHWGNYEIIDYDYDLLVYDTGKFELMGSIQGEERWQGVPARTFSHAGCVESGPAFVFEKTCTYSINAEAEGKLTLTHHGESVTMQSTYEAPKSDELEGP